MQNLQDTGRRGPTLATRDLMSLRNIHILVLLLQQTLEPTDLYLLLVLVTVSEQSEKQLLNMLAEADKSVVIYSETRPEPTSAERLLNQEEDITPKGTKTLIFVDMFCSLMTLRLSCFAIMAIVTFEGKRGRLASLRTRLRLRLSLLSMHK